jgi:hypothetical protein
LDLPVTLVGFAGQIEWDLPVILNWISRSFSVGLSNFTPIAGINFHQLAKLPETYVLADSFFLDKFSKHSLSPFF